MDAIVLSFQRKLLEYNDTIPLGTYNIDKNAYHYVTSKDLLLPRYDLVYNPELSHDKVTVIFNEQDSANHSLTYGSSVFNKPRIVSDDLIKVNFVHDFTFNFLSKTTDVPLSKITGKLIYDQYDNLTPDYVLTEGGNNIIIEFATVYSADKTKLLSTFKLKLLKYSDAIANRVDHLIKPSLYIIVVGLNCVVHNLIDDDFTDIFDEMIFRYNLSLSFRDDLVSKGAIKSDKSIEYDFKEKIVLASIGKITSLKPPIVDPLSPCLEGEIWSKASYKRIINKEFDRNRAIRKVVNCFKLASESVGKNQIPSISRSDFGYKFSSKEQLELMEKTKLDINGIILEARSQDHRTHLKSVVQIPFLNIVPEGGFDTKIDEYKWCIIEEKTLLQRIWGQSLYKFKISDQFESIPVPDEINEELWQSLRTSYSGEEKLARSKYHRINLDISENDRLDLACIGVNVGVKDYKNPYIMEYRKERKKPFPIDIDTTDIHSFLLEHECNLADYCDLDVNTLETLNLIKDSCSMHDNTMDEEITTNNFINKFLRTRLGRFSTFLSDLAFELNLSLKQNCKTNQFILKKLARFEALVLIKPTSSDSHIFFSLLIDRTYLLSEDNPDCFKDFEIIDDYLITDFISLNISKLTNWLTTESRMINAFSFFCEFHRVKPKDDDLFKSNLSVKQARVFRDLKLSLLIHLTDKDEIEDELTRLRYLMMEGFVNYPFVPNPGKMLVKVNKRPKSRLTCYIIQKSIDCIELINIGKWFFKSKSGDDYIDRVSEWKNIFNPLFFEDLNNPGDLINLFYLGYMNNKNKTSEKNVEGNLYTKIIEMENKFYVLSDERGYDENNIGIKLMESPDEGYHLYDPEILSLATDYFIKLGNELHHGKFLKVLENDMLTRLSHLTIEDNLTTLKASSNFNESIEIYARKFKDKTKIKDDDDVTLGKYSRSKVIQNSSKLIDNEILVIELLPKCLEYLEAKNCLHVDIFKKNQFGGLREIYVLGIEERVCQLIIETISRSICSMFNSETMTHPESKTRLPENHSKFTNKIYKGTSCVLTGTSDDAEKWNQTHYVSKFYHFLILLTPEYFHPFIQRILILWMNKKIMISDTLMELFDRNHDLQIENETIYDMWRVSKGLVPIKMNNRIMENGNRYIRIRTGMMQGILHYTSSVLHTIVQEFSRILIVDYLNKRLNKPKHRPICTIMQSSDDSCMMLSLPHDDVNSSYFCLHLAGVSFKFKQILGKYLGIYPSIKSTIGTPFCMEFNSQFFFDNSKYMPFVKSVFASTLISEQESLQSRQEELSTLVSDVISNGGSFFLANMCQWSQALLYYRLLGMSVNPYYKTFIKEIVKIPDPSCGYFLMDHPLCTGVSSFRYNLWNICNKSSLGRLYKSLLRNNDTFNKVFVTKTGTNMDFETIHAGSLARKIVFPFGNRKKWTRVIKESNIPDDWEERLNENPVILYRKSLSSEELRLKYAIKLHSPGVSKSFDVTNHLPRIVSSSVYLQNYQILEPISAWYTRELINDNSISVEALMDRYDLSSEGFKIHFMHNDIENTKMIFSIRTILKEYTGLEDISNITLVSNKMSGLDEKFTNLISKLYNRKFDFFPDLKTYTMDDGFVINTIKCTSYSDSVRSTKSVASKVPDKTTLFYGNLISCYVDIKTLILTRELLGLESIILLDELDDLNQIFPKRGLSLKPQREVKSKFSLLDCLFSNNGLLGDEKLNERELNFLFPYHNNYIMLHELLSTRYKFSLKMKNYERRKTSTKLNVYDIENSATFSPDKIIGCKWFNLKTIPASTNVLNKMFDNLKELIYWLTEDPDESLKLSPFNSHLQLQNWLARSDLKKRVIKVMGAPLISRSGQTNLINAICLDYSSGYELEAVSDDNTDLALPNTLDVKHSLFMITASPVQRGIKENYICKVLKNYPSIPYNGSRFRSRTNILSTIQSFLKGESKEKLIEKISHNKLGIIGGYEVPQPFDKPTGTYKGFGIWKGVLNGLDMRIFVNTNKNTGVNYVQAISIIRIPDSVLDVKDAMKEWLADHGLSLNSGLKIKPEQVKDSLYHLRDGFYYNSINSYGVTLEGEGCPIFVCKDMTEFDMKFKYNDVEIHIDEKKETNLHLIVYSDEDRRWKSRKFVKVLKYQIKSSDFFSGFRYDYGTLGDINPLMMNFLNGSSLSSAEAKLYLKDHDNQSLVNSLFDKDKYKPFLKDLLNGALITKGISTKSSFPIPEYKNLVDSGNLVTDTDINNIMTEMIASAKEDMNFDILKSEDDGNDLYELTEGEIILTTEGLLEFGEEEPEFIMSSYTVIKQSRLFHKYIESLMENYGLSLLRDFINDKIYTIEMEQSGLLDIFRKLYDIDEGSFRKRSDLFSLNYSEDSNTAHLYKM